MELSDGHQRSMVIEAVKSAWMTEVPKARASGDAIAFARANAVASWMLNTACCACDKQLHDSILETAEVRVSNLMLHACMFPAECFKLRHCQCTLAQFLSVCTL